MINDITENQSKELNKFIGEGNFGLVRFFKKIDKEKSFNDRLVFRLYLLSITSIYQSVKHVEIFISKKRRYIKS